MFGTAVAGGGITNSGTISRRGRHRGSTIPEPFFGGITNSGTVTAGATGIIIRSVSSFLGRHRQRNPAPDFIVQRDGIVVGENGGSSPP